MLKCKVFLYLFIFTIFPKLYGQEEIWSISSETCHNIYSLKSKSRLYCKCAFTVSNLTEIPLRYKVEKDCKCTELFVDGMENGYGAIPPNDSIVIDVIFSTVGKNQEEHDEVLKEISGEGNKKKVTPSIEFLQYKNRIDLPCTFFFTN